MTVQKRNPELVELLSADFPRRGEPSYAWGNALSAFMLIHGLRGLWPWTGHNENGAVRDVSGNALTLTRNGAASLQVSGIAPNVLFTSATNDYYTINDAAVLDLIGNEAYIEAARNGMTMGGWFLNTKSPGASMGVMSKWNTGRNQRSYFLDLLDVAGSKYYRFQVSTDGAAAVGVTHTTTAIPTGSWYFVAGRFMPGKELAIYVNTVKVALAVGVPATIYNSTAPLIVGAEGGPANYFDGRAALCFLSAAALTDTVIRALYEVSRPMFGVR